MNKAKAITSFLEKADTFPQLLLVTDCEVSELFGQEVTTALAELETSGRVEALCDGCGGTCCRDVGCELYAPRFSLCPIYDIRPLVCRFHFCHRFDAPERRPLILDVRDIFLGCFTALEYRDSLNLRCLDTPPLGGANPQLVAGLSPLVEAVRRGDLDPEQAARLIRHEAERYRNGWAPGDVGEPAGGPQGPLPPLSKPG